jgi:hypothetical protein
MLGNAVGAHLINSLGKALMSEGGAIVVRPGSREPVYEIPRETELEIAEGEYAIIARGGIAASKFIMAHLDKSLRQETEGCLLC